jgi:ATP-dependent 26S proteasome regulatory subunit
LLREVVDAAGCGGDAPGPSPGIDSQSPFELPGRPELAAFFNEHVVDIVRNKARYAALGIGFPGAIVLHGPPGCGKTFAVEKLIEYLGWPSLRIEAASVASPYIHDTSKKVAAIFEKAIDMAPSVLVIDEMEAFLADREMGQGHHRVEEVAEFLMRIPEAVSREVLIIAMTNRVEMIDAAILRRGRFDHIIKVDYADEIAVLSLLTNMMSGLPHEPGIDLRSLAASLARRPLSDVAFVVREAGRRAAKDGRTALRQEDLSQALAGAPPIDPRGAGRNRIGFV